MPDIPRGKYIGRRVGDPPKDEPSILSVAQHVVAGSTAATSLACSHTRVRYPIQQRINRSNLDAPQDAPPGSVPASTKTPWTTTSSAASAADLR